MPCGLGPSRNVDVAVLTVAISHPALRGAKAYVAHVPPPCSSWWPLPWWPPPFFFFLWCKPPRLASTS
jgi:hypothetical protein